MMAASFSGFTKSYEKNCFSEHIRESIHINETRKPIYSSLTNGRSEGIFKLLLTSERFTLPVAKFYDWRAEDFQKNGVPLFCYEFMSMNATPAFNPQELVVPKEKFVSYDYRPVKQMLLAAIRAKDISEIKLVAYEAVAELEKTPEYHCMLRHMLESIYRFAYFLPKQIEAAESRGLKSPLGMSLEVMRLHALSLGTSNHIDEKSAPIQEDGIPILCSELPRLMDDLR